MSVEIEILAAVQQAVAGIGQVEKKLNDLGGAASTAVKPQARLNDVIKQGKLMMGGAALGAATLVGAYKALIAPTVDYAKEVRDLGRTIGTSADETSRLIQLADDYMISTGDLTTALNMAVKNGFVPSTDNLAKLADEYNGIQDPLARADLMVERFGRNWTVLTPLLAAGGDAIRAQSAAISPNLILTEAQTQKARELEIAQDALSDAIKGTGMAIGNELIPPLTRAATAAELLLTGEEKIEAILKGHATEVRKTGGSYEDYATELRRAAHAADMEVDAEGRLIRKSDTTNSAIITVVDATYLLSPAARDAADAFDKMSTDTGRAMDSLVGLNTIILPTPPILAATASNADIAAAALDAAAAATDALKSAQDAWAGETTSTIQAALEAAGVKGAALVKDLNAADIVMGTLSANEEARKQALAAAATDLAKTGDVEAFKNKLIEINDKFSPEGFQKNLEDSQKKIDYINTRFKEGLAPIDAARLHIDWLNAQLGGTDKTALPASVVTATTSLNDLGTVLDTETGVGGSWYNASVTSKDILTHLQTMPPDVTTTVHIILDDPNHILDGSRASGGPVAGGQSYLVGEQGPEMFIPPRGGGMILPTGPTQSILNQNRVMNMGGVHVYNQLGQARFMQMLERALG